MYFNFNLLYCLYLITKYLIKISCIENGIPMEIVCNATTNIQ